MSTIYGFYTGNHSACSALLKDGEIINAIEEERLTRIKSGDNYDSNCLLSSALLESITEIKISEADHRQVAEPLPNKFVNQLTNSNYESVSHHDAHCYGAYLTSGMEGKVLSMSYDGGGDYSVMKIYLCEDGKMSLYKSEEMCNTGSLSHLWGFSTSGIKGYDSNFEGLWKMCKDEGKLMGMAPNGRYDEKIYRMLSSVFKYKNLKFYPSNTATKTMVLMDSMRSKGYFETQEQMEIFCFNLQLLTNNLFIQFLEDLHKNLPEYNKICLSGGLFANVKLNQKINELDWVKEIYIFPPMGDEGLALGAAIKKSHELGEWSKPKKFKNLLLGKKYTDREIFEISKEFNFDYVRYSPKKIAEDLNNGSIIGWFQDGSEYGPRALGGRSILVRPTDLATHSVLNSRLKRHDTMPFAPIILSEHFDEVFQPSKSKYTAEFMTLCYDTKLDWVKKIPAVIQKSDNTARPQIVVKENLPKFWEILNEYYKLSGIPLLLNTSFNSHNEPIIENPSQAFSTLQKRIIDKLVIQDYVFFNK